MLGKIFLLDLAKGHTMILGKKKPRTKFEAENTLQRFFRTLQRQKYQLLKPLKGELMQLADKGKENVITRL